MIVIDAGANIGIHTLALAQLSKRVYSYEPQREIFELLENNVIRNGLERRVVLRPTALSHTSGEIVE